MNKSDVHTVRFIDMLKYTNIISLPETKDFSSSSF
jgi:hypothetical protein